MTDKQFEEQIKQTVSKYLPSSDYRIFLFGSRAIYKNYKWSDMDIGILGDKAIPGHIIVKIQDELENSRIPYKIDLVDFTRVSDQFRKVAMKNCINL